MRPVARAGLVAIGYAAAFGVAWLVLKVYVAATNTPDRQSSGGMYACGDSILFLTVFGIAAVPATAAALYFLRSRPAFWNVFAAASFAVAGTGIVALFGCLRLSSPGPRGSLNYWLDLSPLRILVAPLFAILFFLGGLFAPKRFARISLFATGLIETIVFILVAFTWFSSIHR